MGSSAALQWLLLVWLLLVIKVIWDLKRGHVRTSQLHNQA